MFFPVSKKNTSFVFIAFHVYDSLCRGMLSEEVMSCISRLDPRKESFVGMKKKRVNYFPYINIKRGLLTCKNEQYLISKLCQSQTSERKPCTLLNTNETIELDPW